MASNPYPEGYAPLPIPSAPSLTPIPTVVSRPMIYPHSSIVNFGNIPIYCLCEFCNSRQYTYIKEEYDWKAHLSCLGLCLIGCDFGCCLIPYCFDDFKIRKHYCCHCHKYLGKHIT